MKLTLNNVGNLQDTTTAETVINNNFDAIETAFENTFSRDGTTPNQITDTVDMNAQQMINLPQPATANSPVRLQDLSTFAGGGTVTNIPIGGNTGDALVKSSNSNYAVSWAHDTALVNAGSNIAITGTSPANIAVSATPSFTSVNKVTITPPATSSTLTIANGATLTASASANVSGTNTGDQTISLTGDVTGSGTGSFATVIANNAVTNAKAAQMAAFTIKGNSTGSTAVAGDISIPALTQKATPVGADIVMIADSAASNALKFATVSALNGVGVTSIAGNQGAFTVSTGITNSTNDIRLNVGQLPGEPSTGSASAGNIGEFISSTIAPGSAIALTSGVALNVTSISLTAGDWDVSGNTHFIGNAATVVGYVSSSINNTTATMDFSTSSDSFGGSTTYYGSVNGNGLGVALPPKRFSLSGTTTIFLVAVSGFTVNTSSVYGSIRARRIR